MALEGPPEKITLKTLEERFSELQSIYEEKKIQYGEILNMLNMTYLSKLKKEHSDNNVIKNTSTFYETIMVTLPILEEHCKHLLTNQNEQILTECYKHISNFEKKMKLLET